MNVLEFWLTSRVPLVDETSGKQLKGDEIQQLADEGYVVKAFEPTYDFRIVVQLEKE